MQMMTVSNTTSVDHRSIIYDLITDPWCPPETKCPTELTWQNKPQTYSQVIIICIKHLPLLIQLQSHQWITGLSCTHFTLPFKPSPASSVFLTVCLAAVSSSSPETSSSSCWPASRPRSRRRKTPPRPLVVSSPTRLPCSPLSDRCTHLCKPHEILSHTHTGSESFVLTR